MGYSKNNNYNSFSVSLNKGIKAVLRHIKDPNSIHDLSAIGIVSKEISDDGDDEWFESQDLCHQISSQSAENIWRWCDANEYPKNHWLIFRVSECGYFVTYEGSMPSNKQGLPAEPSLIKTIIHAHFDSIPIEALEEFLNKHTPWKVEDGNVVAPSKEEFKNMKGYLNLSRNY